MSNGKKEEKKSGFLSSLKSAFVVTEESTAETETKEVNAVSEQPQTVNFANTATIPQVNGAFDTKFHEYLLGVIEKNNLDGVDYFEFSKSKKNLDNAPGFTEQMKYQSAFGVLQASTNLTKERLLQTADHYLQVLDNEDKDFEESKKSKIESDVTSRMNKVSEKEKLIASKSEEIIKLQTDIAQLRNEMSVLQNEAQNEQFKIESTAKNFKYTLEAVKAQIISDKTNIQNFIQ